MVELSVIIPVYNLEEFLEQCLDSLVTQKSKYTYEVICVNDGSTDRSGEILQNYATKYPDVIRVFTKENEGVSVARNFGIKNSSGKYLTFVDGDDWVSEEMVELSVHTFENNDVDIVISNTVHVFNEKKILVKEEIGNLVFNTENHACGKIFKKSLIEKYNLKFPIGVRVGEDFSFTFSYLLVCNDYIKLNTPFYFYRRSRVGSVMSERNSLKYKDIYKACEELMDFAKVNYKYTEYKDELEYLLIKNIIVRILPKVLKSEFPHYVKTKIGLQESALFIERYFPNWDRNKYFKNDIEGYFVKKIGANYIKNLTKVFEGKLFYVFLIMLDKKNENGKH
ncbi:glycosyltransferase [Priestia aryabhattai]|uniref:glycosyltransferase family 2 protein n=1 Tax=Priestia aryabhattai TaxID=412384 RepID=UPI00203B24F2|nr:glycosyltransferase [Priestia aryabhattai]MCM2974425.1 glycosyltransferase [Priestia aryabhattai]